MRDLPEVIADILASRGAMVEKAGEDGLDVIASPELVSSVFPSTTGCLLQVKTKARMTFTLRLGLSPLERLFTDAGRWASVNWSRSPSERIAESWVIISPWSMPLFAWRGRNKDPFPIF